jgi:hypothetical protein
VMVTSRIIGASAVPRKLDRSQTSIAMMLG